MVGRPADGIKPTASATSQDSIAARTRRCLAESPPGSSVWCRPLLAREGSVTASFKAKLQRPAECRGDDSGVFSVLPKRASNAWPRRGRTSVKGTVNGVPFHATLDPDGQLSHWLMLDQALCAAVCATMGDTVSVQLSPVAGEPEPTLPADPHAARRLAGSHRSVARHDDDCPRGLGPLARLRQAVPNPATSGGERLPDAGVGQEVRLLP